MQKARFARPLLALLLPVLAFIPAAGAADRANLKTENVLLVTLDGVRWQEVFSGADESLLNKENGGLKEKEIPAVRTAFWRETPDARRVALMPFLWSTVARHGQLYGNQTKGSVARVTNDQWFSYPGYNEILAGFADPEIKSNDKVDNRNATVLEWLHNKPAFHGNVAAFHGWDAMAFILNRKRAGFPVFAAWEPLPEKEPSERQTLLNDLIAQITPALEEECYDAITFHAAEEHLRRHHPRVLYVGLSETDSHAHAGRYDRVLQTIYMSDAYIHRLWDDLQSMDQYRDKTTLIITTDHGRGSGPAQWKSHSRNVPGSNNIWIAVMGPDTPALGELGEGSPAVTQSQVAATLARFLGEDYHAAQPRAGEPIATAFPKSN